MRSLCLHKTDTPRVFRRMYYYRRVLNPRILNPTLTCMREREDARGTEVRRRGAGLHTNSFPVGFECFWEYSVRSVCVYRGLGAYWARDKGTINYLSVLCLCVSIRLNWQPIWCDLRVSLSIIVYTRSIPIALVRLLPLINSCTLINGTYGTTRGAWYPNFLSSRFVPHLRGLAGATLYLSLFV